MASEMQEFGQRLWFVPSDLIHVEETPVNTYFNISAMVAAAVEVFVNNAVPQLPSAGRAESGGTSVTLAQATSHSFADGLELTNAANALAVEYVNMAAVWAVTANHTAAEEIAISPI